MINEDIITQVWELGSDTIMPSNKQTDRRIDMILLTGEGMTIFQVLGAIWNYSCLAQPPLGREIKRLWVPYFDRMMD